MTPTLLQKKLISRYRSPKVASINLIFLFATDKIYISHFRRRIHIPRHIGVTQVKTTILYIESLKLVYLFEFES